MDTAEYETNALLINDISSVAYAFYELVAPPPSIFGTGALELEGSLRNDGYLAHLDTAKHGLWCFRLLWKDAQHDNPSLPKTLDSCGYTLALSDESTFEPAGLARNRLSGPNSAHTPNSSSSSVSGALDSISRVPPPNGLGVDVAANESKPATSTSTKDVYEHFISAVISALSAGLCSKIGATPLDSRTLLLPPHVRSDSNGGVPQLASLRAYLTTTGALVSTVNVCLAEGLSIFSDSALIPSVGRTVLAAPLGVFATCYLVTESDGSSATENGMGQSPDLQVLRPRPDREERLRPWRNICIKLLEARNLPSPISGTQKWLSLQRVRRKPVEAKFDGKNTPLFNTGTNMTWPSSLCFCKAFQKLSLGAPPDDPARTTTNESYDPLSLAKSWFLSAGERDEALIRKAKERDAAVARDAASSDSQVQQPNGTSPLALHRSGHPGVPPGAMYPTPPDGVQAPVGATPSMDGTVSSPANNNSAAVMADVDTVMSAPPDTFTEAWDQPVSKRERHTGSFDSENLFGDLGPDMFGGDNDITDADFNFFDEQPGDMDMSLDLPDMSNSMPNLDLTASFGAPAPPEIKPVQAEAPVPLVARPAVFAKPELKHARSSLVQESKRPIETETGKQEPQRAKRQASPFNPDTVFKRIRASLDNRKAVQHNSQIYQPQSSSVFQKVDFGPDLSMVDSKYQGNGRFDFTFMRSEETRPLSINAPPKTNYLQRHIKGHRKPKGLPSNPSPSKPDDVSSDADEGSLVSDQDDSTYESDEPPSPVKSVSVRKRRMEDDEKSLATSFKDFESVDAASPSLSFDVPVFSKSDVELPLVKYFADPEPIDLPLALPDQEFIMAAQLLTDQASTSTLSLTTTRDTITQTGLDQRRDLMTITHKLVDDLRTVLPRAFGDEASGCQFRSFIEVQDVPLLGQPSRLQPRPPGADQIKPSNPFQIPSPHVELRRYESKLSVLPSAVAFWESLGLGPSHGGKAIDAVCIFPELIGISDDADVFLDRMQSAYESLKLGAFGRMNASPEIPNGLMSYQVEKPAESFQSSPSLMGPNLSAGLSKLSEVLAHLAVKETNFVVFFVYSSDMAGAAIESCYAFQQLFERYKKLLMNGRKRAENDMALQLIPLDFLASSTSIPMPCPADYMKLAFEVYDRCTLFNGAMPSPAIVLEQPLPRIIDFKLTSTPTSSLLHENSCLHLAYAQSVDERWITAAWSDNRGCQQLTASYCLGRRNKSIATLFADVAHEIWETTRDITCTRKVHWRIMIAKCGVMDQAEIETWSNLAQAETRCSVSLTLATVDTNPSLQLIPPTVKVPTAGGSAAFYTTPVSTPQASIVSPEQSGNGPPTPSIRGVDGGPTSAPTPGGGTTDDSEADATLVDVTDHMWGAVLAHRLSNSMSPTDLNPAIVSGYLVKRGGPRPEDPPAVMEVNIVHSEGCNPRAYETAMRELLTYYRGLGTLARARGMVDKEVDCRPWHIAAAEKGCRTLYMLM
ncbi:hypothetical protein PG991_007012 [Apiospora marii]|uniref:Mediator of RNA polymerase II transcription subunit 13 n=1 Tax=Apiospora marii TaxID=335849 RepID=A0ABR1RYX1_9PEZI